MFRNNGAAEYNGIDVGTAVEKGYYRLVRNNESAVYNGICQLIDSNKETTNWNGADRFKGKWTVTPPSHNQREFARTWQINPTQNKNATQGRRNSTQQVMEGLGYWLTIQLTFNKQQQNKATEEKTQTPTIKRDVREHTGRSCNSF